ncbi:hypothetical protein D3C87_1400900 [compost metagenome]
MADEIAHRQDPELRQGLAHARADALDPLDRLIESLARNGLGGPGGGRPRRGLRLYCGRLNGRDRGSGSRHLLHAVLRRVLAHAARKACGVCGIEHAGRGVEGHLGAGAREVRHQPEQPVDQGGALGRGQRLVAREAIRELGEPRANRGVRHQGEAQDGELLAHEVREARRLPLQVGVVAARLDRERLLQLGERRGHALHGKRSNK